MRYYGLTDQGKVRKQNEDCFYIDEKNTVFFVADGMGGHNAGQVASQMSSQITEDYINEHISEDESIADLLRDAIVKANSDIYQKASKERSYSGMGTTVEACAIKENKLFSAHVGDSRLYRLRDSEFRQLTTDHSYVEMLIRNGDITREEAREHPNRNVITRAVGTDPTVEIDSAEFEIKPKDVYLLCTDGLTEMLEDSEIQEIISRDIPLKDQVEYLVQTANEKGGTDNVTVLMIQI